MVWYGRSMLLYWLFCVEIYSWALETPQLDSIIELLIPNVFFSSTESIAREEGVGVVVYRGGRGVLNHEQRPVALDVGKVSTKIKKLAKNFTNHLESTT